jgi:hypothetical protein
MEHSERRECFDEGIPGTPAFHLLYQGSEPSFHLLYQGREPAFHLLYQGREPAFHLLYQGREPAFHILYQGSEPVFHLLYLQVEKDQTRISCTCTFSSLLRTYFQAFSLSAT